MKSWKIGALSGLIAGIVAGILAFISIIVGSTMKFYPASSLSIESVALNYIMLNLTWGIIFGVFYSMIYKVIPSKGAMNGLLFGLIILLIGAIRPSFFLVGYAEPHWARALTFIGFFTFTSYGLVLGTLYRKIGEK